MLKQIDFKFELTIFRNMFFGSVLTSLPLTGRDKELSNKQSNMLNNRLYYKVANSMM